VNEPIDIAVDLGAVAAPLPPIVSLREFVEQIEQEYGGAIPMQAVRAAMEEAEP